MLIVRTPHRRRSSPLEARLYRQIVDAGLPEPMREFPFHPTRQWRADFAWLDHALLAEVEGGIFAKGRHTRGMGFSDDSEKYNAAVLLGWRVLRFTEKQILKSTVAVETIRAALAWSGQRPMFAAR